MGGRLLNIVIVDLNKREIQLKVSNEEAVISCSVDGPV